MYVHHMYVCAGGCQRECQNPWNWSYKGYMWLLGTKPWSTATAASAPNCQAISPDPYHATFKIVFSLLLFCGQNFWHIAQAGPELTILPQHPSKCWDYRQGPLYWLLSFSISSQILASKQFSDVNIINISSRLSFNNMFTSAYMILSKSVGFFLHDV